MCQGSSFMAVELDEPAASVARDPGGFLLQLTADPLSPDSIVGDEGRDPGEILPRLRLLGDQKAQKPQNSSFSLENKQNHGRIGQHRRHPLLHKASRTGIPQLIEEPADTAPVIDTCRSNKHNDYYLPPSQLLRKAAIAGV